MAFCSVTDLAHLLILYQHYHAETENAILYCVLQIEVRDNIEVIVCVLLKITTSNELTY